MNTKYLQAELIRAGATIANVIQDMERELQRMKDKKISQEYIDNKDSQIQTIVTYYNQVDELFNAYKLTVLNEKIENHFLTEMLLTKVSIDEVLRYKPHSKVELIYKEIGHAIEISKFPDING